jgi:hypothetical protein
VTIPPGAREVDPEAEGARLAEERLRADHEAAHAEQECILRGGHCFERTGLVLMSNPPQYPECCKHCGKKRIATPRDPWEYTDA